MRQDSVAAFLDRIESGSEPLTDLHADGHLSGLTKLARSMGYDFSESALEAELGKRLIVPLDDSKTELVAAGMRKMPPAAYVYTSSNVSLSTNINAVSNVYVVTQVMAATYAVAMIQVF